MGCEQELILLSSGANQSRSNAKFVMFILSCNKFNCWIKIDNTLRSLYEFLIVKCSLEGYGTVDSNIPVVLALLDNCRVDTMLLLGFRLIWFCPAPQDFHLGDKA